jgi:hypothetical protein
LEFSFWSWKYPCLVFSAFQSRLSLLSTFLCLCSSSMWIHEISHTKTDKQIQMTRSMKLKPKGLSFRTLGLLYPGRPSILTP